MLIPPPATTPIVLTNQNSDGLLRTVPLSPCAEPRITQLERFTLKDVSRDVSRHGNQTRLGW